MDELDIARAIAAGELTSPQKYRNVWLFAIRITGTGYAYRSGPEEHVWRDASLYLNDEFLARCNGLAVIWVHPKKSILDSEEFGKRVIGAIMLPYIQVDEVWGIAKIYDDEAATKMAAAPISTSPGVQLNLGEAVKLIAEDGKPLLIEGSLDLLDHVAIVPLGVWDKSGPPAGVLNNSSAERADTMAETEEEKKAREEKERADANAGQPLDKILAHLDSISKRMDAMEMADKARKDADEKREREDRQRRMDAEREEWRREDAAACERDDAEEAKEREELEGKGEPKEVAADKARRSRKDRMKARKDAAESEAAADKARRDAEEKARKDAEETAAKARADAVALDNKQIAALVAGLPKSRTDADYAAMADAQARADAQAYQPLGLRAPEPLQGETLIAYRARLARGVQRHSKPWAGIDLAALPDNAFGIAETQIYADAQIAARAPDDVPDGTLLQRRRQTEAGHMVTEFIGKGTFIRGLKRPSQRVTAFLTAKQGG